MKHLKLIVLFSFWAGSLSFCQEGTKDFDEIIYEARTRGSSLVLKITSDKLFYKDRNHEKKLKVSKVDKKKLIKLINNTKLSDMSHFKSVSDHRTSDRAMQAELCIKVNGQEYKSSVFDHGNPPEELKEIIETMMRLGKPE